MRHDRTAGDVHPDHTVPGVDPTAIHIQSEFVPPHLREADFHEVMAEQLQRAPWLAVSMLLNFLVILFLYHFLESTVEPEQDVVVQMQPPQEVPVIEEEPQVEKPIIEPEEVDPEISEVDAPPTEVVADTNEAFEDSRDAMTESAFDNIANNTALGHGGPPAGRYGSRGRGPGGNGGGRPTQQAVERALKWLADHQDQDGRWDSDGFMKHDAATGGPPCDGAGNPIHDVGVTSLALLAFLADGNTLRAGPYQDQVKRAVRWLIEQQDPRSGLIGSNAAHDFIYDHAIATYALVEAQGLSRTRLLKPRAQAALNYLEAHRNPYMVWRYQPQDGRNDTSVTGWCVMAYESGQHFDYQVNPNALEMAATWFEQVSDPITGRHGYESRGELSSRQSDDHAARFPRDKGEAMTAVALFCRYFMGQDPTEHPVMDTAADLLLSKPPVHDPVGGSTDHYYWYYATYALYQAGGQYWKEWQRHLKDAVVDPQRDDGNFLGSWDASGAWGHDGGRVYATALNLLTLQVYYRYTRIIR